MKDNKNLFIHEMLFLQIDENQLFFLFQENSKFMNHILNRIQFIRKNIAPTQPGLFIVFVFDFAMLLRKDQGCCERCDEAFTTPSIRNILSKAFP